MKPLQGIRVLDLSRVLAGPFCTMNLGDMGAEVFKIEEPLTGDDTRQFGPPFQNGVSTYFLSINRNKKSIAVNLKSEEGRALVQRLADTCDVVVENFRPKVATRLGLGPDELRQRNPRLIYCSISGFGHQGLPEYSQLPGYDVLMQGLSGLQHLTGFSDGPPTKVGVSISDILSGMTAFQSILLALFARERSGVGQFLDVSMQEATTQVLTFQATAHLIAGRQPQRLGNRHPSIVPYESFPAKDGYFNLAVGTDEQFEKLCRVLGDESLLSDERFRKNQGRVVHVEALVGLLRAHFAKRTVSEWMAVLTPAGVPCGEIYDVSQALAHPQLVARGMLAHVTHPVAGPIRMLGSALPLEGRTEEMLAPPVRGAHTRDVFQSLGVPERELEQLASKGVLEMAAVSGAR